MYHGISLFSIVQIATTMLSEMNCERVGVVEDSMARQNCSLHSLNLCSSLKLKKKFCWSGEVC